MSVGWAPRALLASNCAPNCSSSLATRRETAGLDRPIRSAARAKEPVSATRTKARTSRRSADERSILCNTIMSVGGLLTTLLAAYLEGCNQVQRGFRNAKRTVHHQQRPSG